MKNIIFCGVGGQGVILASKVLMETAKAEGFDVKESEVHGMAQRGGSVNCNVRFGEKVFSPIIPKNGADFIVSFELLESIRMMPFISDEGMLIVNNFKIDPVPVQNGAMTYPANIPDWLEKNIRKLEMVDTDGILSEIGNRKALNIIMLGFLSRHLPFREENWMKSIETHVKPKFVDLNKTAFQLTRK
ncbi:MAG: indolepyruvate oxidoreductase subunit beta [Spirochaetota bacterium]